MNRKLLAIGCGVALAVGVHAAALAHHGDAGRYNESVITLTGTVVAFRMINPHSLTIIDVQDSAGQTVTWQLEGLSAGALIRSGWTKDRLRPGDRITVTGRPLLSGEPFMNVTEKARIILTSTGEEILRSEDYVEPEQ